ncbi:MAG: hypothetical protein EPO07_01260 [Verrucomicrobia bacterium]|nr:MAG: hypothetical protein EPO07_01260 [Verrucomicrobiota bacterium]
MKRKSYLIGAATVAIILTLTSVIARPPAHPPRWGTDILHWFVFKKFNNEDTNSTASASVDLKQNAQGKANNQRIDFRVRSLQTNAPFQLWALVGDDTNYVHVADFTSDRKGNARLDIMKVGSSNGKGPGRGKLALPAAIDPISNLRALAVGNVNTQAVLTADLTVPDKLEYLIKRRLSNTNGVVGHLFLGATTRKARFELLVWGLAATNTYHLALNDEIAATVTATTNGFASFNTLPSGPTNILDLHTLAVWDSASNSVISTHLP